MEALLEKLLRQSYLFDDPRAYQAGVEDALAALRSIVDLPEDLEESRSA